MARLPPLNFKKYAKITGFDPLTEATLVIVLGDGMHARATHWFAKNLPKEIHLVSIDPYYENKKYSKYPKRVRESLIGLPAEKIDLSKLPGVKGKVFVYARYAHTPANKFAARLWKISRSHIYAAVSPCHYPGLNKRNIVKEYTENQFDWQIT